MRKALARVREAGKEWHANPSFPTPPQQLDYTAMVEDGQGSKEWRDKLALGALVPSPFLTGGCVGVNPDFSLSAVREFLVLKGQGVELASPDSQPEVGATGASQGCWRPRPRSVLEAEVIDFVDALCPEDADRENPPAWVDALLEGDLLEAKEFWQCMGEELVAPASNDNVQRLVAEAKARGGFKDLPGGAPKSDAVWLLELAAVDSQRSAVVQAFEWLASQRLQGALGIAQATRACQHALTDVQWQGPPDRRPRGEPVRDDEKEWLQRIEEAQRTKPYEYTPVTTEPIVPDRHPWDGLVYQPTFTEISAGIGTFAACFRAAGARCIKLVEPVASAFYFASRNCDGTSGGPSALEDTDPADFAWSHGIVGGPECQPFSVAGAQGAWADSRSYTMLRTLHLTAVMQPWWVWLENVKAIEQVKNGRVWVVIKEIAQAVGYVVRLRQV